MFSVALIGPDGAGKSTVSRALAESSLFSFKTIYMGDNVEACNFALPTTRLLRCFRKRWHDKNGKGKQAIGQSSAAGRSRTASLGHIIWAVARLVNFIGEEWYRQLLSWSYQARGYIVLYDRHFLFDFSLKGVESDVWPLEKRVHRWILTRFYPRPNLVIYLDAPAEVLFARKGEKTLKELENRRQAFLRQGAQVRNFVRVDSTQPLDEVCAETCRLIAEYSGRPSTADAFADL